MQELMWVLKANFADRDDAIAASDLLGELGYKCELSHIAVNEKSKPMSETRLGKIVLGFLTNNIPPGRSVHYTDVGAFIAEAHSYKANSANSTLTKLVEEGKVERCAEGIYRLSPAIKV